MNERQRQFVREYLVDLNATQAAIRAGYAAGSAHVTGARMLTDANVSEAIAAAQLKRAERVEVKADDVLRELIAIVKTNPSHFTTDEAGNLTLRDANDTESWRAVSSVKQKTRWIPQKNGEPILERELEFKLWDKNSAIDKAMRHLGILANDVNVRFEHKPGQLTPAERRAEVISLLSEKN